jgi:hypothetical protein
MPAGVRGWVCPLLMTAPEGFPWDLARKNRSGEWQNTCVSFRQDKRYAGPINRGAVMTTSRTFVAAAALTLLIGVPTAQAQHRGGGGSGQSRGASGGGHNGASSMSAPRSGGGAPRGFAQRTYSAPRAVTAAPRSYAYGASRAYGTGFRGGVVVGRSVPRVIGPRAVRVAPVRFFRPYYVFRPRLSLGFGLWAGFPITYPYSYGYYDPYFYPGGYSYGYSNPYPSPAYGYPSPYGYPCSW